MKKLIHISFIILAILSFSCDKFMEPAMDSYLRDWQIEQDRNNFKGLLYNTYAALPVRHNFIFEAATDNAVTNIDNTNSSRAARGGITYINNPLDDISQNDYTGTIWAFNYTHINRVNYFLEKLWFDRSKKPSTPVIFELEEEANEQTYRLLKGEAFFMRAWFQFDLLQKYGGVANDGIAWGFPILTKYITVEDELDLPRNTYQECVDQIVADCDTAFKYLAFNYTESDNAIWNGGVLGSGRASGVAALALKTRALLYSASPAYNKENNIEKWEKAAIAAKDAIDQLGGLKDLIPFTNYISVGTVCNNTNNNIYNNPDMFFRGPLQIGVRTYEQENFPPRAGGKGMYNPTQNLVDAFPMRDGYPISASSVNYPYNENNMYVNRDPRLTLFIMYHNHPATNWGGVSSPNTIETQPNGNDAFGTNLSATRTGYYLRKFLNGSVRNIGKTVNTNYATVLLGKPELYLNFAEAVFHATGSPLDNTYGYSARDALAKIRNRALGSGNDKYMAVATTNNAAFLTLLRNERRIELCFEGHRFWDLRRWSDGMNDLTTINVPVYGVYSSEPVELREFKSPYMPLPYSEMLKTKNLKNNAGW